MSTIFAPRLLIFSLTEPLKTLRYKLDQNTATASFSNSDVEQIIMEILVNQSNLLSGHWKLPNFPSPQLMGRFDPFDLTQYEYIHRAIVRFNDSVLTVLANTVGMMDVLENNLYTRLTLVGDVVYISNPKPFKKVTNDSKLPFQHQEDLFVPCVSSNYSRQQF